MLDEITIYHGSPKIVENPTHGAGNPNNDYGLGFYCTQNVDLAKEWACSNETDGFANRYKLKLQDLSILSLTGGGYHILNWLSVLIENRRFRIDGNVARQAQKYIYENFGVDYKSYDIIKGYRADDSYFSFANAFLNNAISVQQLEKAMVLGELGEQIVLKTKKAFAVISFEEAIPAPNEMYFPRKLARDTAARDGFREIKEHGSILDEKYILDIMREKWRNDDKRLQRIILA